jgi:hypothetical protein
VHAPLGYLRAFFLDTYAPYTTIRASHLLQVGS